MRTGDGCGGSSLLIVDFHAELMDIRLLLPDFVLFNRLVSLLVNNVTSQKFEDNSVEINITVNIRARAKFH